LIGIAVKPPRAHAGGKDAAQKGPTMANDDRPDHGSGRRNRVKWDDLPLPIIYGAAVLAAGVILLVMGTHPVVAAICVILGAALLLWCLRLVRANLSARHVGPQVPRGPGDVPFSG